MAAGSLVSSAPGASPSDSIHSLTEEKTDRRIPVLLVKTSLTSDATEHKPIIPADSAFRGKTSSEFQNTFNHAIGAADFVLNEEIKAIAQLKGIVERVHKVDTTAERLNSMEGRQKISEELNTLTAEVKELVQHRHMNTEITSLLERAITHLNLFPKHACVKRRLGFFKGMPEYLKAAADTNDTAIKQLTTLHEHFTKKIDRTASGDTPLSEKKDSVRGLLLEATSVLDQKTHSLPGKERGWFGASFEALRTWSKGTNELYTGMLEEYSSGKKATALSKEIGDPEKIFEPVDGSPALAIVDPEGEHPIAYHKIWDESPKMENSFGEEVKAVHAKFTDEQSSIERLYATLGSIKGVIDKLHATNAGKGIKRVSKEVLEKTLKDINDGLNKAEHPSKKEKKRVTNLKTLTLEARDVFTKHKSATPLDETIIAELKRIDTRLAETADAMNKECNQLMRGFESSDEDGDSDAVLETLELHLEHVERELGYIHGVKDAIELQLSRKKSVAVDPSPTGAGGGEESSGAAGDEEEEDSVSEEEKSE